MYHIPGSTPEAPFSGVGACGKKPIRETIIGDKELKNAYKS
jgi:hypothetical protein